MTSNMAFCLYLMNKMRGNLIKIRSSGSTGLTGFVSSNKLFKFQEGGGRGEEEEENEWSP